MPSEGGTARVIMAALVLLLGLVRSGDAAVFDCASGDVACLIAAINTANTNGQVNTIRLEAGIFIVRAVDNDIDGSNGLPSITSPLTLGGAGAGITIIEREATAPPFRLIHVGPNGLLKLQGLTARGGRWGDELAAFGGGGLLNLGTTIVSESALTDNVTLTEGLQGGGGGIASLGKLVIAGSLIANNMATRGFGGGVFSTTGVTVVNSTIRGNVASDGGGGLWTAADTTTIIIGSTIAGNRSSEGHGGGLHTESTGVAVVNSTFASNSSGTLGFGGALFVSGGVIVNATIANNRGAGGQALAAGSALALHNTIVSGPSDAINQPCRGPVTSLGNNLFTDPSCAVALLPDDVTGDARLGDFVDNGTPGHGFFPLLRRSPAIDAGGAAACPPTDQRGQRRRRASCDIGAIEGTR